MVEPLWKKVCQFLKKLSIELPYDPAVPLLDVSQRELKTYVHTQMYTQMFIVAIFIMAKK